MPSEKTLKTIVIVLGVLLVIGFMVVVITIINRIVDGNSDDIATEESAVLTMPVDSTPLGVSQDTRVTILKVRNADGVVEELVFDSTTGDYIGKLERDQE